MNLLTMTDLDWPLVKCVGCLHSSDPFRKEDAVALQLFLEDAIKSKYGFSKDLTNLVTTSIKQDSLDRVEEYKPLLNNYEDTKGSNSDDELELDLLKEDLMCVVCNGMDVAAGNQLIECSDCHALYHQDCHRPVVSLQDSFDSWICTNCKDISKKSKLHSSSNVSNTVQPVAPVTSSNVKSSSKSSSHRHGSSSSSDNYKSSSDKYSKSSSSKSSKSQSSSSSRNITPNINIISADKRIQNMKKKAAKLQEKRKLPKMC